jgi:hypothetical protein
MFPSRPADSNPISGGASAAKKIMNGHQYEDGRRDDFHPVYGYAAV